MMTTTIGNMDTWTIDICSSKENVRKPAEPTAARFIQCCNWNTKGSPYSITESRVLELIPLLGSQPAGDVSHKLGGRLPLLSARPAVTYATY